MKRVKNGIYLVKAGELVRVLHIVGPTLAFLARPEGDRYRFCYDAYCKGQVSDGDFYHLRHARKFEDRPLAHNRKPVYSSVLRRACEIARAPITRVPGGSLPVLYSGELAIPDFEWSGTRFYVVRWSDVEDLKSLLPEDNPMEATPEAEARLQAAIAAAREEAAQGAIATTTT